MAKAPSNAAPPTANTVVKRTFSASSVAATAPSTSSPKAAEMAIWPSVSLTPAWCASGRM